MFNKKEQTLAGRIYKLQDAMREDYSKESMYEDINRLYTNIYTNEYSKRFYNKDGKGLLPPLTIEIMMGNKKEVNRLLNEGKNIEELNGYNLSPLFTAIYCNNEEIVKLLVEKGANVNLKWENTLTPLHLACRNVNDSIIKTLTENGANVNELDVDGYNALHHLLWGSTSSSYKKEIIQAIQGEYIKEYRVDVLNPKKLLDSFDILVNSGIDINYSNEKTGVNALSVALERRGTVYTKIISNLIELGAKKDAIEMNSSVIYGYKGSAASQLVENYLFYLEYKKRVKNFGINVYSKNMGDGEKRPAFVKRYKEIS